MELFILGMLFVTVITPILDSFTGLIVTALEVLKGKMAVKVSEYNYHIQSLGDEPHMNPIGFVAPEEGEEAE